MLPSGAVGNMDTAAGTAQAGEAGNSLEMIHSFLTKSWVVLQKINLWHVRRFATLLFKNTVKKI